MSPLRLQPVITGQGLATGTVSPVCFTSQLRAPPLASLLPQLKGAQLQPIITTLQHNTNRIRN